MDLASKIAVIVLAAAVGEGINEFFFLPWLDAVKGKWNETVRVQVMRLWSGLVGIGIAYELSLDIFSLLNVQPIHAAAGWILTGLLLGRGSNWIHELIKSLILSNQVKAENVTRF